jgi:hypothetical protein
MGQACVAGVRHDLARVAELGSTILRSFDLGPAETRLVGFLSDLLRLGENGDGSFGRLVDERRLAVLAGGIDAGETVTAPALLNAFREVLAA